MKQSNILSLSAVVVSLALLGVGCTPTSQPSVPAVPSVTTQPSATAPADTNPAPAVVTTPAPAPTQPTAQNLPAATKTTPAPVSPVAVSIANFSFQPISASAAVGATVTWTNNDSAPHTITADDGSFESGTLAPGATYSRTFSVAGTAAYHCAFHASMHGSITITQ